MGAGQADAQIEWLDKTADGAVEARATRRSDRKTVAIEHTIVEPFVGDKGDFASFAPFLSIEKDKSLLVSGRWISVFIPIGTLRGHKKDNRKVIVKAVHDWLKTNRVSLHDGFTEHPIDISLSKQMFLKLTFYTRVIAIPGNGALSVRRQQTEENLSDVIEKALKRKVPKLVKTEADKHILILERQHMNLYPGRIMEEVEKRRSIFRDMAKIDEIWIVETMFYERESYLRFERYVNGALVKSLDFQGDKFLR